MARVAERASLAIECLAEAFTGAVHVVGIGAPRAALARVHRP